MSDATPRKRFAPWIGVAASCGLVLGLVACTNEDPSGSSTSEAGSTAPSTTSLASHRDPDLCPDDPWMAADLSPSDRAQKLIEALTLDQKLAQTHGDPQPEDFRVVPGIPELCIPDLTVTNGPAGVGASVEPLGSPPATAMPAPLAVAATWDPGMSHAFGDVVGEEMVQTGRNLLESPDVDLARVPYNGRTFEAFGEDPHLVSRMAVKQIRAVQDHGVIAMVKHYVANNQETDRTSIDAVVSERVLHEMYLAPFEAAVTDGDVASVMCAYNKVNGVFNCENESLLRGVLRDQWGFEGFVQSDFGATQDVSAGAAVEAGMNLEMPSANVYGDPLRAAVAAGTVTEAQLDDLLAPRYTQIFRLGIFDRAPVPAEIPVKAHAEVAQEIAEAGTVLLRNEENTLPIDDSEPSSIAVVGTWATKAATGGGGSSIVNPIRSVTPLEGITERASDELDVLTPDSPDVAGAVAVAEEADMAIVVVGEQLAEGTDRESLSLPEDQDAFISAVAAASPRTVVVVHGGAPVLMPWLDEVSAVVMGWYPGGEDGTVTASVLFGDAEPSGRLPITFPAAPGDLPTGSAEQYPGVNGVEQYSEGLAVGYRHYLANNIKPLFPFGYGLSYTTFELSDLEAPDSVMGDKAISLEVEVKNTGKRGGSEVVQAYVEAPEKVGEPSMSLKGFTKVHLKAGESKTVKVELDPRAFSHWDESTHDWAATPGTYRVLVGTSSEDTPLEAKIELG